MGIWSLSFHLDQLVFEGIWMLSFCFLKASRFVGLPSLVLLPAVESAPLSPWKAFEKRRIGVSWLAFKVPWSPKLHVINDREWVMSSYIHLISIDDPPIYSRRCSMMYSLLIKQCLRKNLVPLTFMLSALWNKGVFPAISYSSHLLNTCPCVVESVSTLFVFYETDCGLERWKSCRL